MSTDSQGQFTLPTSAEQEYPVLLAARAPGYEWATKSLESYPGAGHSITLSLSRGVAIRGLVLDETGRPVPGVRVIARAPWNTATWPAGEVESASDISLGGVAETGEGGDYSVDGLTAGQLYDLSVESDSWVQVVRAGTRASAPSEGQVLTVGRLAALAFVFPDGQWDGELPSIWTTTAAEGLHGLGLLERATAQRQVFGYRVDQRADPERLTVKYSVASFRHGLLAGHVNLQPGSVVEEVVRGNSTVAAAREGAVAFQVAFSDGTPYTGTLPVSVRRMGPGGLGANLILRCTDGLTEDLSLPLGTYQIASTMAVSLAHRYWKPFEGAREVHVEEQSHVHALEIRGGAVRVHAESPEGVAVRGCLYRVLSDARPSFDGGWLSSVTQGDEDGTVRMWLSPGTNTITASLPQIGLGSLRIDVPEDGAEQEAVIRLVPGPGIDLLEMSRRVQRQRER